MIKIENIIINDKEFKKTYSDNNKIIRKIGTNEEYTEAVDILSAIWEYEETDKEITNE